MKKKTIIILIVVLISAGIAGYAYYLKKGALHPRANDVLKGLIAYNKRERGLTKWSETRFQDSANVRKNKTDSGDYDYWKAIDFDGKRAFRDAVKVGAIDSEGNVLI